MLETKKPAEAGFFVSSISFFFLRSLFSIFSGGFEIGRLFPRAFENLEFLGGGEEDRTPDLRIANATLSQLRYPPNEPRF
jgi:hypothetical protein